MAINTVIVNDQSGYLVDPLVLEEICDKIPNPSTATPIADNEQDNLIRTGVIGTSTDFARADHNHPIVRQSNPGDPTITLTGTATLNNQTILDRWSTEEWYAYRFRVQVTNILAGNNWVYLTIPTKAGFQQPMILDVGSYRSSSDIPQNDNSGGNSGAGAAPRGPLMGDPVHHWSSTNRIYYGYFRRDNNLSSLFVEFTVKYIRS